MASSAPGAAEYWPTPASGGHADEQWHYPVDDVFDQEGPAQAYVAEPAEPAEIIDDPWPAEGIGAEHGWDPDEHWAEAGYVDDSSTGVSGRGVVVLGAAAVGACAIVDLVLTAGRLTFFFDLCFVVVCLVTAMSVRRRDVFSAGVLPPLLYAGVIAVLSVVAPGTITTGAGISKVFLTGLSDHAFGLVSGYAVALLAIAARVGSSGTSRR